MTREEFKYIVAALKSNYRNFGIESKQQFDFWYSMLGDIDFKVMQIAVKKLVSESTYAPTIADIRKTIAEITMKSVLDPAQAWGEVTSAISKFGIYRPEEALNSMSPMTRRVVQAMNYKELCLSENQMADRAHFIKLYEQLVERERKDKVLAMPLQQEIRKLQENKTRINENISKLTESFQLKDK